MVSFEKVSFEKVSFEKVSFEKVSFENAVSKARSVAHVVRVATGRVPIVIRDEAHHLEDRRQTRLQLLFGTLTLTGSILEIGAGRIPMAPKRLGYDVTIVDRVNADELRERYHADGIIDPVVEEVDATWDGRPIVELLGDQRFDYVIASHVIEHVPDMVAFLNDLQSVLKPDGQLGIVVPHKAATFDIRRSSSTLARVVDAHVESRVQPSPGAVAEHYLYATDRDGRGGWPLDDKTPLQWTHPPSEARDYLARAVAGAYFDVHVWCFDPPEFEDLLLRLRQLHLIDLVSSPTVISDDLGEFYCVLRRSSETVCVD